MIDKLRAALFASVLLVALGLLAHQMKAQPKEPQVRNHTDDTYSYSGPDRSSARVAEAEKQKLKVVKQLFADAGVSYPPRQMLLRVFKEEMHLEVWAASKKRDEDLVHVATYEICSGSGGPGPKRKQGDGQVPEGFYVLDLFNNHSQFYLSMRISYPNKYDKAHRRTGSAIMIHGNCVSIGCLAMSDERIQELWVMTKATHDNRAKVHVHLFPARDLDTLIAGQKDEKLKSFWVNIKEGFDYFEQKKRLPKVTVKDRKYQFR